MKNVQVRMRVVQSPRSLCNMQWFIVNNLLLNEHYVQKEKLFYMLYLLLSYSS